MGEEAAPDDHLYSQDYWPVPHVPTSTRHDADPDCSRPARLLWARSMTQPAPETIRTPKTRIACDGTGDGLADAALGHPRVWLEIAPTQGSPTAAIATGALF